MMALNENFEEQLKLLEREVVELEDYINDFWSFLPTAIAYINPTGIVMDANNALAQMIGLAREDIIGTRLQDYALDPKMIQQLEQETLTNGFIKNVEVIMLNQKSGKIGANFSSMIRKDSENNIVGYFVNLNDLSSVKLIQSQLEGKLTELEEFHDVAVGRELKMIELEKEVNSLLAKLGHKPKYEE